ncbi:MAG: thiamine phosphate synthase [Verrucomicrobiota bacterium]
MKTHDDKMSAFEEAGVYLVTSESLSAGRSTLEIVKTALEAGIKLVQLREKDCSARKLVRMGEKVRNLTRQFGALLIINDRVDVALAVEADGVHLGQDDFPVEKARVMGPDLIIGASTHSLKEALEAEKKGASYVNIGPVYPTGTKSWTGDYLGIEGLKNIAPALNIPFTVMGGIKAGNLDALKKAGANVFAVVTAITAADDPASATKDLLKKARGETQ